VNDKQKHSLIICTFKVNSQRTC